MANQPAPPQPTLIRKDAGRPFAHTQAALDADELGRTRAFLWVSGSLGVAGGVAALGLGGNPYTRAAFVASIGFMVLSYLAFALHIRKPERYTPVKALLVVTAANMAGVLATVHYGVFSPAPMVLMVPLAYFGMSNSGLAAGIASGFMGSSLLIPSLVIAARWAPDPGLLQAEDLSVLQRVMYALLVQLVLAAGFALARTSRRATRAAFESLEQAVAREELAVAQAREAHSLLEEARARGKTGPMTGQELGGWRLGVLVGRGGAGEVYEARPLAGGKLAAVKVLRAELLADPLSCALTEREAQVLSALDDPHLVRILEFALKPRPYLAMELLKGEDLEAILRRRSRLPIAEVGALVREGAAGLAAVHRLDVVHRDVKPGNLFAIATTGPTTWKLLDLGVSTDRSQTNITQGMVLGTPGYMSPEQVRGERLDARSDQFSFACVAYRSLTGRPAFSAPSPRACMLLTLNDQPPRPSQLVDLPAGVDAVLALALAKDPDHRFEDIGAFAAAMVQALGGYRSGRIERRALGILRQRPWAG